MTAFAPPDAAEQAGLVRNPVAERKARHILTQRGFNVSDKAIATLQADIVRARAEQEREKAEARALRLAQRDPEEKFRWDPTGPRGRGGY